MLITLLCHHCAQPYVVPPSEVSLSSYCSRACKDAGQCVPRILCVCESCGSSFAAKPWERARGRGKYCSRACWRKAHLNTSEQLWSLVAICSHGKDCPYCCWPWLGKLTPYGYGLFKMEGKTAHAHRFTWEDWHQQPMPTYLLGAHYCHRRDCTSPSHIHPGSQKENLADSVRDHRLLYGESKPTARLTEVDIPQIFILRRQGFTQDAIAQHLHVSRRTIHNVLERKVWRHVSIPE